jgi:hypothetical protein
MVAFAREYPLSAQLATPADLVILQQFVAQLPEASWWGGNQLS